MTDPNLSPETAPEGQGATADAINASTAAVGTQSDQAGDSENTAGAGESAKLACAGPGGGQPTTWEVGLLKVIWLPVVVAVLHLGWKEYHSPENAPQPNESLPKEPVNGVVLARLGIADADRKVSDKGTPLSPVSLTLWVRNLDGWLMDRADANDELLRNSGFTTAQWKTFRERSDRLKPFHDKEMEWQFQDWFKEVAKDAAAKVTLELPDEAAVNQLLTFWGRNVPVRTLPDAQKKKMEEEKKSQKDIQEAEDQFREPFHFKLLKTVRTNPALLKTLRVIDTATGTAEEQVERLKVFLANRGRMEPNSKKDNDTFQAWFHQKRLELRLVIGNQEFESLKPELHPVGNEMRSNASTVSIHRLVFRDVKPAKEEYEAWRKLIKTYGVECSAPVTVCLKVPDAKNGVTRLMMPTAVNASAGDHVFSLPLRPVLMRSLAWATALGVLCLLVVTGRGTGVLHDRLPDGVVSTSDQPYGPWSLSRVVFAWWLAICTSAFVYLWAMTGEFNVFNKTAALLLGIQGSTLLAASWVSQGTAVKGTKGFLNDLVSENGEAEISRLQMLVWNGVLGVVFVWQTLDEWKMPEFGEQLTVLMGISSSAYVGYKQINKPTKKEEKPVG